MLALNKQETIRLVEKRVLKRDAQDASTKREYFETMISSMDMNLRDVYGHVLLACMNKCFKESELAIVDQVMEQVFACMPEDLTKNWLKISAYLTFLKDLAMSGTPQLLYLMEHRVITKLVDLFLENDSPAVTVGKQKKRQLMGSNYARPPFEQLLYCLSYIARMQSHVDLAFLERPQEHVEQEQ
jgi:hypothetical protein